MASISAKWPKNQRMPSLESMERTPLAGTAALHIQETRIRQSKFLLLNTTKPLKEIAYDVGFNNPDYFSTAFRRITGISPLSFRKAEGGGGILL